MLPTRTPSSNRTACGHLVTPALSLTPCLSFFIFGCAGSSLLLRQWVRCRIHLYVGLGGWRTQAGSCLEPHPISRLSWGTQVATQRETALEVWLWVGRPLLDIGESVFLTAFFSPYLLSLHWLNTQYTRTGTTTRQRKAPGAD